MTKFEEEFNYLIGLSGKVLIGQVDAETFEKNRIAFFEMYETDQQQAPPVVPEYVGEWIEHCKGMGYSLIGALTFKLSSTMYEELSTKILKWLANEGNDETFSLAFITGEYEVEKPQKFYLKNKLTGLYLYKKPLGGYGEEFATPIKVLTKDFKFTQTEIDGMNAQGYDKEDEYKGE